MNKVLLCMCASFVLFASCTSDTDEKNVETSVGNQQSKSMVGIIDGKVFSVPSPYEFISFINELGISYNHSLINSVNNKKLYESNVKKCINFGVYGVDVAYVTMFEQTSTALTYFSVLKQLSEEIGLSQVFDAKTIERLENNMHLQDSLLIILTKTYREADKRLKNEKQKEEAAFIIAGSWIESLYLLTQIQKEKPNKKIVEKIAEHKYYADNVLALLRPYYEKSEEHKKIIDDIIEICYQFDGVKSQYTYKEPVTYPQLKRTVIQSDTKLDIYAEHLQNITIFTEKLRNSIVN
ncbi:MAG TPA: hypothetical protein PK199_04805 [Bacteroidales bacterium]|nr:hypothetical protein [Bacteroidales bacterium]